MTELAVHAQPQLEVLPVSPCPEAAHYELLSLSLTAPPNLVFHAGGQGR